DLGAAVAEVPRLVAVGRAEGAHLERDRVARAQAKGREVVRVDRRRQAVGVVPVHDVDVSEVVVDAAGAVGDLEDLTVDPGPRVGALHRRAAGRRPVGEGPVVAGDLAVGGPRAAAVERDLVAGRGELVRAGDGEQARAVLALVGLPEEGVTLDDAPLARGLLAGD